MRGTETVEAGAIRVSATNNWVLLAAVGAVVVVAALELGAFVGGALEETRAVGAWLAVGGAFVAFGLLERSAVIAATGASAALFSLVAFLLVVPALGVTLELATAAIFAGGALVLRGQRPSAHDHPAPAPQAY